MQSHVARTLKCLAVSLAAVLMLPAWVPAAAYVKRGAETTAVGNDQLELRFADPKVRFRASELANKLSGRTIALRTDDFSLGVEGRSPLRAADCTLVKATNEAISGGQRLVFHLESAAAGVKLRIVYELGDSDFYLRRRLEAAMKDPLPLRQVDVWLAGVAGRAEHQGFGQPVLLEDTFWGLEFPASHNHHADGTVKLTQHPGRTAANFTSKTAVLGVAEPGQVVRRFRQYVDSFRVTPKETALFVNYNTWWTLMPPTEKNSLELIDLFRRKLFEPYGESIDTFTLDDGWDDKNSLWAIRKGPFPNGFAPLVSALKGINARLGIWLSPSSGYGHAPWGRTHGYEGNSNPWALCQSGPNYRRDIVKVVTELAKKYEVAFFKFDGFVSACDAPGHGHLPGPYSQEANVDAYIELLTAVRGVRPNIYLDPTCGIWLSPWWLRYADSLWGEVSGDYPDIIVPAPIIRDSATTTRDGAFRERCRQHPGFPPAAIEHLGIIVISPEKWEDNAMIVAGRGCRLLTLYIDPKFYQKGDRDWAFLASLLKWVRHNAETLQKTELVLGDPMKREPYGYAHFRGQRGIVAIRNPFIEPRTVEVKLDESAGWTRGDAQGAAGSQGGEKAFVAKIVYPRQEALAPALSYGDTLRVRLEGYETAIVHVDPISVKEPVLLGARCQEVKRADGRIEYAVFGRTGQKVNLALAGLTRPETTSRLSPLAKNDDAASSQSLASRFDGDEQPCSAEGGHIDVQTSSNAWRMTGACTAHVPAGSKASMYLLFDPRGTGATAPQCSATVNGKPAVVRVVCKSDKPDQAHGPHAWVWFVFDVPEGRSEISVSIEPPKDAWGLVRGEVGWWLWAEHPLRKGILTLDFAAPLPPAAREPLPLPVNMESQRQIVTIVPAKFIRAGNRWPKADQARVHLDEVAPDECSQDYGTLQRNRSVWEKEMIIAGKKFSHGLGAHANGRIVYDLAGGRFKTFGCLVGRDEHAGDGRVVFEVWLDGKRVFSSGPMTKANAAKEVSVDVQGAATLELRSLDGGDGISGDHANWADAQLTR